MINIERLHKLIANSYSNKEFALHYLFHLCNDPEFLTYKDMFEFEPANKLTNLVNHGFFINELLDKFIIKRFECEYIDCFDDGRAKFLSVIKDALYEHQNSLKSNSTDSSQLDSLNKIDSLQSDNVNKIPDEPTASPKTSIIQNLIHNGYYSTIENGVLVKFDERDLDENGYFATPDNVKRIGESSFECCANLKHLVISNGVTHIEDGAFACCTNLEEIKLPTSLKSIGKIAFLFCRSLKSLTIPPRVTKLEYMLFPACLNLNEVVLHKNIKNIDSAAFCICDAIPVNLPEKLKQDWIDGKFENGLIHPFYNILDCIRERNGLEPLNLDPKY